MRELDENCTNSTAFVSSILKKNIVQNSSNLSLNSNNQASSTTTLNSNSNITNTSMNRVMRATHATQSNDLTLPPIIESQVANHQKTLNNSHTNANYNNNINNNNNGSSRVDSGIVSDFYNENSHNSNPHQNRPSTWTLSTNGSEQDYELSKDQILTTIEFIDVNNNNNNNNNTLKKNITSSTLNSYGKSSSFSSTNLNQKQKPITTATTTTIITSNNNNKNNNKTTTETNFVDICEKLNTLNEVNNNYFINHNNKKKTGHHQQNNNYSSDNNSNFVKTQRIKSAASPQNNKSLKLNRQNTTISVTQTKLNGTVGAQQQQQPPPTPKPRHTDSTGLTRQNTLAVAVAHKNQQNDHQTITIIQRPKTSVRQYNKPIIHTLVNGKTTTNTSTPNMNTTSIVTVYNNNYERHPLENLAQFNPPPFQTRSEDNENGMNEYTYQRIVKWLADVEKSTNIMKPQPSSQLTWNENTPLVHSINNTISNGLVSPLRRSKTNLTDQNILMSSIGTPINNTNKNNNNDFCFSDYDSHDEQIVEYNRVVDKTFHFVYNED